MTEIDFIGGIGWRDVVLALSAVIGVYLVLSVMRLFRVAGKRRGGARQEAAPALSGWQPDFLLDAAEAPTVAAAPQTKFAEKLALSNVEVECQTLRREWAQLREEVARLADEVSRLKATRNVSPLYNEATVLAQQGMPASGIAGHCGISIGEAELVAALARSGSDFERHEQGEDRDERNTDSGNRPRG
ncbi:MAG: DUF2802 domain-containing protein [Rhodocyclaceae bacterium]|nr:DUF2802 domain-containing protein [Rhodocyclaceae bacterium]